jgi:thiamine-phosphate pyrophosphorylase
MLIAITNRTLCRGDFLTRIRELSASGVDAILLREKDLSEAEYEALAQTCLEICKENQTPLWLNAFPSVAERLYLPVQLSFSQFLILSPAEKRRLPQIGVSVHAVSEAVQAAEKGADSLIAGHIFPTACKPGLPPRGLSFLQQVCDSVEIPVYAIGGITAERQHAALEAGAKGCCVMSEWMQCEAVAERIALWKNSFDEKN